MTAYNHPQVLVQGIRNRILREFYKPKPWDPVLMQERLNRLKTWLGEAEEARAAV